MNQSPEMFEGRYTDEDFRRDPSLMEAAVEYTREVAQSSDFTPLVNAALLLSTTGRLTVPVARTVLNCARHDARYAPSLPRPASRAVEGPELATVTSLAPVRRRKKKKEEAPVEPTVSRPGEVYAKATLKTKFFRTRTGVNIHQAAEGGPAETVWRVPYRAFGWLTPRKYRYYKAEVTMDHPDVSLRALSACGVRVRHAIPVSHVQAEMLLLGGTHVLCKKCAAETQPF